MSSGPTPSANQEPEATAGTESIAPQPRAPGLPLIPKDPPVSDQTPQDAAQETSTESPLRDAGAKPPVSDQAPRDAAQEASPESLPREAGASASGLTSRADLARRELAGTILTEPDRGDALAVMFFLALFVTSLLSMLWLFRGFWTDIILALVFSALSRGLYLRMARFSGRPLLAASLVCALIVVLVAVPTTFLVISLSSEAAHAIVLTRSSVTLDRLEELLFGTGWMADQVRSFSSLTGFEVTAGDVKGLITGAAGGIAQLVYEVVNGLLANVLSGIFHFMILIAIVFYLLVDGVRFRKFVFRLSPLPDAHEEILLDKFGDVGRAILFGNGIGSAIQGILGGLAMSAAGLPSPVLWGTVMTIFAFLPVVGVSFVVIPATAYLALTGRFVAALAFFVFCGFMALVVENVVKTRLIGSHMQMHDLLIFLSVIGGIGAFGILGLLYGPLLVTLFLTLAGLYETAYKDRIQDPLARSLGGY